MRFKFHLKFKEPTKKRQKPAFEDPCSPSKQSKFTQGTNLPSSNNNCQDVDPAKSSFKRGESWEITGIWLHFPSNFVSLI